MLKRKIEPLNIRGMEDGEISHKKEKSLNALVAFWEENGPVLLNFTFFNRIEELYDLAQEQLEWLERTEA